MSNSYHYEDPQFAYIDPQSGLTLQLNPPDNKGVYERYMAGTVEGDVHTLTALILELITAAEMPQNGG